MLRSTLYVLRAALVVLLLLPSAAWAQHAPIHEPDVVRAEPAIALINSVTGEVREGYAALLAQAKPRLPEPVYDTLVAECARYPWPVVQSDEHLGELLNWVAWQHRDSGVGLSRKSGGRHVESPVGPIAEDILQYRDGHHYDVLGSAAVGNPLDPGRCCPESIGVINLRDRPWVAPVEHVPSWLRGSTPPPGGGSTPPPVTTPPPAPVDLAPLVAAIDRLTARVAAIESRPSPSLDLFDQFVDDMVGRGPADDPALAPNHITDVKARLDVIRQQLEQLAAWLRSRPVLRF